MNDCGRYFLCRIDELADPGSAARTLTLKSVDHHILLVRSKQCVYGYFNVCPHTGVTLDWTPGQFLSADQCHIQCATHAALFRIDDGFCVSGPCAGERLSAVPLEVEAGKVYLQTGRFNSTATGV